MPVLDDFSADGTGGERGSEVAGDVMDSTAACMTRSEDGQRQPGFARLSGLPPGSSRICGLFGKDAGASPVAVAVVTAPANLPARALHGAAARASVSACFCGLGRCPHFLMYDRVQIDGVSSAGSPSRQAQCLPGGRRRRSGGDEAALPRSTSSCVAAAEAGCRSPVGCRRSGRYRRIHVKRGVVGLMSQRHSALSAAMSAQRQKARVLLVPVIGARADGAAHAGRTAGTASEAEMITGNPRTEVSDVRLDGKPKTREQWSAYAVATARKHHHCLENHLCCWTTPIVRKRCIFSCRQAHAPPGCDVADETAVRPET